MKRYASSISENVSFYRQTLKKQQERLSLTLKYVMQGMAYVKLDSTLSDNCGFFYETMGNANR